MKTYAYITSECCASRDAIAPGGTVGRDEIPVSRHGDYNGWHYGKRQTIDMISNGSTAYLRGSALSVAMLLGWA